MASTSKADSTTHSTDPSRFGDEQILQQLGIAGRLRVDAHGDQLLRTGGHHRDRATADRGLHRFRLELLLDLAHPVLHLLDLAQHLERVLHSETSFTLVTRPSKRFTISRTKGSSSGLAGRGPVFAASASRSRKSIFTSSPSHARTCGMSCADCSCAFL